MRWMGSALALLLTCLPASAQTGRTYTIDRWTVDHGLPNNDITALLQSADGYIWAGSWAGAVRFDGVRFTPIADDVPNAHLRSLHQDRDGAMWIGVSGLGVVRWRPNGFERFTPPDGLPGRDVRAITADREGRVWVATESGVGVIESGRVTKVAAAGAFPGINGLQLGPDGRVRVAAEGVTCANNGLALDCAALPSGATTASAVWLDQQRHLWVGTDAGLFVDGSRRDPGAVSSLFESRDGAMWVGFVSGELARLHGSTIERYGGADGLPESGFVASITQDREGSIWLATSNGGVSRLKPKRVRAYTMADGLTAQVAGSVVETPTGDIWVATGCGAITKLVGERFVPQLVDRTTHGCFREALAARDGTLWIAGRGGGLLRFDGTTVQQIPGLSDSYVSAIFEDSKRRLWVGTETGGLHIFENGKLSRAFAEADGVATHYLASFAEDRDGRIWIGSNANGLSVYENGAFRKLSDAENPPSKNIAGLLIDSRGDLWIGTASEGLYRRRNGKYDAFGLAQGLGDRLVAVLLEDTSGNMWVGTARGISRLERERIEAVANGTADSLAPIILDRSDGMVEIEGSGGGFDPSGLRDRHGRLWFSTIGGIVVVDPARFPINELVAPVIVEGARIDERQVRADGSSLIVPAGTQSIELSYTSFSLLAPAKVQFRYRLRGLTDEWQDVGGRRTAYYTRLAPGEYDFEVASANNDGVWNPAPATVRLIVQPFFWERRDLQALAILVLLAMTGFAVNAVAQYRARRRMAELEREQALTRERTRIARDLHDDLGARLAQIALIAEAGERGDEAPRIATVARGAMQTMDELVWSVNARNDTVESFAEYVAEFAEEHLRIAGLRFRLHADPDLAGEMSADLRRHLFLAFKESVHNIVKHAGASEVRVSLTTEGNRLILRVSDNGQGLPESARSRMGNGLRNMRERMEAVHGDCQMDSPAEGGTVVTFSVPFNQ